MLYLVVLGSMLSAASAQLPPYLNCTRYLEPCVVKQGESCCGYPFYDCISNGREALCQSISNFPELSAELLLRLREAKDRGDPQAAEIQRDVYNLLGPSNSISGGASRPAGGGGGGGRAGGAGGAGGSNNNRSPTASRPATPPRPQGGAQPTRASSNSAAASRSSG